MIKQVIIVFHIFIVGATLLTKEALAATINKTRLIKTQFMAAIDLFTSETQALDDLAKRLNRIKDVGLILQEFPVSEESLKTFLELQANYRDATELEEQNLTIAMIQTGLQVLSIVEESLKATNSFPSRDTFAGIFHKCVVASELQEIVKLNDADASDVPMMLRKFCGAVLVPGNIALWLESRYVLAVHNLYKSSSPVAVMASTHTVSNVASNEDTRKDIMASSAPEYRKQLKRKYEEIAAEHENALAFYLASVEKSRLRMQALLGNS